MTKTVFAVLVCAGGAVAQSLIPKAEPQTRAIVLENATVHQISGPVLRGGWLWFQDGVIRGVGLGKAESPSIPADAERIDAKGLHVYPGLISAVTRLGLVEIGSVRATQDDREVGEFTPEVRAAVAVNPDSTLLPVTRSNGVLAAGVFPDGGSLPGRAAVIVLEGRTWEDMAVRSDIGLVMRWPSERPRRRRRPAASSEREPRSAAARRRAIADFFAAARAYLRARKADPTLPVDVRKEAMRGVLEEGLPIYLRADDLEQIESGVAWAASEGLRVVLVGGRDAPGCLDLLRRHRVPVVVTGTHVLPRRRDAPFDEPFRLPAVLEAAGLKWCLAGSGRYYNERNLPYQAATAVAHGLTREAAIRAITLSAAEILGVGDRLGSLDPGKSATLFLADGDPLEIPTRVRMAFVHGKRLDLRNKQTILAEKYR